MTNIIDFKKLWPHLLAVAAFVILSLGYMSPVLKGKEIMQSDPTLVRAGAKEINDYQKETGQYTAWTNTMFGGMPSYFAGGSYSHGVFEKMGAFLLNVFTTQGNYIFYYLLGVYLLLIALGCGIWTSALGAVGFAFFSYNLQIIEAGHISKVYTLSFVAMMLAGMVMAFRGRYWLGAALFSFGLGMTIKVNHVQIIYYTLFLMVFVVISELIQALKYKKIAPFITASVLMAVLGITAIATNTARLWTTYDYTKESIRGGGELKSDKGDAPQGGLDKDYAFSWSYGKLESLTLLIPNFSGGGSGGELDNKSATYKALVGAGVPDESAGQAVQSFPSYWGDQPFVSGGIYAGAILLFLFVLGLFYADNRYKYPFLAAMVVTLFIAWGKNFSGFNFFMFDHFPMFNKFRSVSMALSLTQLCVAVIAALGLQAIFTTKPSWADFKKPFFVALGVTAGLTLVFALMPSLAGLRGENDPAFVKQITESLGNNATMANTIYNALVDDRGTMLRSDALRSLVFILLAGALLWAFVTDKLKNTTLVGGLLVALTLIDLWVVDKRYLNNDDFQPKVMSMDEVFQPTPANVQIMQDKDPNYRVFDVTGNPWVESKPSYFHKSIGGHNPAKLRRYQDLIENQLSKNNMAVLNMLNTRYFIVPGQDGQPTAQRNPDALGNAWFVKNIKIVANANEEMKAMNADNKFDPRSTAIVEKRFESYVQALKPSADTTGKITLTDYKPNALAYESNSAAQQMAVFSEVYYKGNEDWKSYIDGQEAPHFRTNYTLRGMVIPAGKHKIAFKFDPKTVSQGQKIDFWASIAWVLLVGVALFMDVKTKAKG